MIAALVRTDPARGAIPMFILVGLPAGLVLRGLRVAVPGGLDKNSTIPVITGGIGICHLFVDEPADLDAALPVIRNARIQRPSVCNALDTALIHHNVAAAFLPRLVATLEEDGVMFRADGSAIPYLTGKKDGNGQLPISVTPASPDDFDTEWLSLILGLKVVSGLDEAIEHIQAHSTNHSDGILTQIEANAKRFIAEADSAAVYVNASTRFTDGIGASCGVSCAARSLSARPSGERAGPEPPAARYGSTPGTGQWRGGGRS